MSWMASLPPKFNGKGRDQSVPPVAFAEPLLPVPVSWTTQPLMIGPDGPKNGLDEDAAAQSMKGGNACRYFVMAVGFCGFFLAAALLTVGIIKQFQDHNDISNLSKRLKAAEATIIVQTAQIASINATLIANVAQTNVNTANIFSLNTSVISDEQRISVLETDLNATIDRLTADEVKLLAVMDNVTILQSDVSTLQQDVVTLIAEVTTLQYNVTVQAAQITVLQNATIQNSLTIQNIISYMQGNLSIIDSRLDALNVSYTVTAQGTAEVISGPAIPAAVTWQVRHFVETGGVDVEYLWISDTNWNPTQIRSTTPPYSFQIGNWLPNPPVNATNTDVPDSGLWRPLTPYQKSKFIFPVVNVVTNPAVTAVRWNNFNQTLDFQSNLGVFDAVTIVAPLTFIIGFL